MSKPEPTPVQRRALEDVRDRRDPYHRARGRGPQKGMTRTIHVLRREGWAEVVDVYLGDGECASYWRLTDAGKRVLERKVTVRKTKKATSKRATSKKATSKKATSKEAAPKKAVARKVATPPTTLRLDPAARARRRTRVRPKGGFEATSETSRMAAEAIDQVDVNAQEQRVLATLRSRTHVPPRRKRPVLLLPEQGGGMTDKEIEAATGLSHESASARRRGLVLRGFVRESGHVRLTPSRRWANVWILGRQEAIAGGKNDYARRPSGEEMRAALQFIEGFLEELSPETEKLLAWVRRIATEGT